MTLWKSGKMADFAAEIEAHIATEAKRLGEEGLSEADAAAAARRNFGNVLEAQERFYDSQRILWLEDLQGPPLLAKRRPGRPNHKGGPAQLEPGGGSGG